MNFDQARIDDQCPSVEVHRIERDGASSPQPAAIHDPDPSGCAPRVEDALLKIFADALDDIEETRIRSENRVRALCEDKGMAGTPEADRLNGLVEGLLRLENEAIVNLRRAMRAHPLGAWAKSLTGVGDKQLGRLLGEIGDPAARSTYQKLWAYCGLHVWNLDQLAIDSQVCHVEVPSSDSVDHHPRDGDHHSSVGGVAPHRRKGIKSNWNTKAKMRVWNIAKSCIMQTGANGKPRSPYRCVYEVERERLATAVHTRECVNRSRYAPNGCGTREHPEWGAVGSPLRDGHQHARAMRIVMKEILRDLWIEARRLRESTLEPEVAKGLATSEPAAGAA